MGVSSQLHAPVALSPTADLPFNGKLNRTQGRRERVKEENRPHSWHKSNPCSYSLLSDHYTHWAIWLSELISDAPCLCVQILDFQFVLYFETMDLYYWTRSQPDLEAHTRYYCEHPV
jgi:hypothetical protein